MLKSSMTCVMLAAILAAAQTTPATPQTKPVTPPIKVNVLNVCTPAAEDQKEIAAALASLPQQPRFSADYEVARGRTTVEGPPSDWVRVRRDLAAGGRWTGAQFLFSETSESVREVTVFFSRETKGATQVALEDKITPAAPPDSVLASNTPVNRISVERFGRPHLVLARCAEVDQAAYEPLFRTASTLMTTYRKALDARQIVSAEVGRGLTNGDGRRPPKVKPMSPRK